MNKEIELLVWMWVQHKVKLIKVDCIVKNKIGVNKLDIKNQMNKLIQDDFIEYNLR